MSKRPTLPDFVDDEMLRAPLVIDQVVDAVQSHWQQNVPTPARLGVDPARLLARHRSELVSDAIRELRQLVQSDVGQTQPIRVVGGETTRHMELSLIDEDEVAADIEVTRAVDRIKQVAEFELRELQAFTSALVNDLHVSRDTNPFRPEAYVRSLWHGVRGLPMSRSLQGAFMRDAAEPLARVLRQGYAAACTRLEEQGVEPAAYRTIVVAAASRSGSELTPRAVGTLAELRGSVHSAIDASPAAATAPRPEPDSARVDAQSIELLTRLFDAIHDDPLLSQSTVAFLLRLQPTVLRIAVREPAMLEAFDHPVWRFADMLAFVLETAADAELERSLAHCRRLVDQLVGDPAANSARFEWALSRVVELDRHLLAQGIAAAQPAIARVRAAIDTASTPLDVGTLDTVPADLLPDSDVAATATLHASNLQPGDRLRAYLHGDWRLVQYLWSDPLADVWLLRDLTKDRPWALRGRALDRLLAERLAQRLEPRSLVRSAAQRVLRAIDRSEDAAV